MALRWTAPDDRRQAQFRNVKGYRQLLALLGALADAIADQPGGDHLTDAVTA